MFTPLRKDQEMMSTYVHNKLKLSKISEAERIEDIEPLTKRTTLMYNYETEMAREEFWMTGDEDAWKKAGFEMIDKKVLVEKYMQVLLKLLNVENIVEKKEVEMEITHTMSKIVEILRMCNRAEMLEIHRTICQEDFDSEKKQKINELMSELLSVAGTKVTIEHLIEKIEKEQITPLKASFVLKTLVNTPVSSEKIVYMLLKLAKGRLSLENAVLRQSALLTVGAQMNTLCSEHKDMLALEIDGSNVCTREMKKTFVGELETLFQNAETKYEKILVLKTLANSGIDISVHFLEKIIYDKREEIVVRLTAVDGLRMLREFMPRKIQSVLLPIFRSRREPVVIRMNAIYQIINSRPSRNVLDQIVEILNKEMSLQVRSFTYNLLNSFTKSTNPCEKILSDDIKVALRLLRNKPSLESKYIHLPFYSDLVDMGFSSDFATVFTNESILPEEIMGSLNAFFAGQWNKQLLQIGVTQQNLDSLILPLLNKIEKMDSNTVVRGMRTSKMTMKAHLRKLVKSLGIVSRRQENTEQFGMLYLRYKNLDYAVLPIDETIVKTMTSDRNPLNFLMDLARGIRFDTSVASYIYEYTRTVPTTFGLPLRVSQKMPTIATISGQVKAEVTTKLAWHIHAEPTIVSSHVCEMTILTPFKHTGVRVSHSFMLSLPLKQLFEMDKSTNKILIKINLPSSQKRMFMLDTRPTVFVRTFKMGHSPVLHEKTVVVPKFWKTNTHYEKVYNIFGLKTEVLGSVQRYAIEKKTPESILYGENHIQINLIPEEDSVKEIIFEIDTEVSKDKDMERPTFDETFEQDEFQLDSDTGLEMEYDRSLRIEAAQKHYRNMKLNKGLDTEVAIKMFAVKKTAEKTMWGQLLLNAGCKNDFRFCNFAANLKRVPLYETEDRDWEMNTKMQIVLPEMVSNIKQLKEQKHRELQTTIEMRWGTRQENVLAFKIQGEQDRELLKLIRDLDTEKSYGVDFETLFSLARLNKFSVLVNHDLSVRTQKKFSTYFNLLKSYLLLDSEITDSHRRPGTVLVKVVVDPIEINKINLLVETSDEKLVATDMYLPLEVPTFSIRTFNPMHEIRKMGGSECSVLSSKINTFDRVIYKAPFTMCYSVLAKDCSEEPEYAVLVKKVSNYGDEKQLKVLTEEHTMEFELVNNEIVCILNGKKTENSEYLFAEYGILLKSNVVEISLNKLNVRFDGFRVNIVADNREQNTICGLCGNFDGHVNNEFVKADSLFTGTFTKFTFKSSV